MKNVQETLGDKYHLHILVLKAICFYFETAEMLETNAQRQWLLKEYTRTSEWSLECTLSNS